MSAPPAPIQDAIEHLYAVLGEAVQRRRNYTAESSTSPPVSAQVSEIAQAIVELAKVNRS